MIEAGNAAKQERRTAAVNFIVNFRVGSIENGHVGLRRDSDSVNPSFV
jgi:hypothetical protein